MSYSSSSNNNDTIITTSSSSSSPFHEAVVRDCCRMQVGENGMPEYSDKGIGSDVLALSQLVRGAGPEQVDSLVKPILARGQPQEIADMIVLLFSTRNARGGKGEKSLSYDMFVHVWKHFPTTAAQLLPLFAHYGYWKDLLMVTAKVKSDVTVNRKSTMAFKSCVLSIMAARTKEDMQKLEAYKTKLGTTDASTDAGKVLRKEGPKISLLAKWLPREGSSLDKKIGFVDAFSALLWPAHNQPQQQAVEEKKMEDEASTASAAPNSWQSAPKAQYRRVVAELTSFLALPEVLLAAKREDEIEFHRIASVATLRLRKTFLNEDKHGQPRSDDPKRARLAERFLEHTVTKGLKGKQLMPHEIVAKILGNPRMTRSEELVLDAQWKSLWQGVVEQIKVKAEKEGVEFNPTRMIPMADVSGSMSGTPMQVSIAMSIGISEITHPAFQDLVLTFHSSPTFHKLNATDTIVQKVRSLERAPWGMSTNFEAAYDLVLGVAERHSLSREDMPSIIVFSDMQFDQASGYARYSYGYDPDSLKELASSMATMHDVIGQKVERVATKLGWDDTNPSPIVYWNLRNTGGHPVDKDQEGAVLLSGFSPSLLKLVMEGEALREKEIEVVLADGTTVTEKVRVTPEEMLRKMLDDNLYDPVRSILSSSTEGPLAAYKPEAVDDSVGVEGGANDKKKDDEEGGAMETETKEEVFELI